MIAPPVLTERPKKSRLPLTLGLVAAFIVLGGGGLLVYVGIRIAMGVEAPRLAPGFGKPAVKDAEGGWKRCRFADLGIEVELPAEPRPDASKYERLEGLVTLRYAEYKALGEWVEAYLYGYGYRPGFQFSAREIARASRREFASDGEFSNVRSTQTYVTVGGRRVTEQRITFRHDGEDGAVTELILVGKHSSVQIFVYDYTEYGSGLARIKRTLRFLESSTLEGK